ncbi:hypothetical protein [Lonsdalea populi]|uniref:hypothetical protein n=1 Tax=Lonsdalea populi TaxID=1172565 RepID=UPI0011BF07E9|nr:hypothetical protein [Lonsdalea populi]
MMLLVKKWQSYVFIFEKFFLMSLTAPTGIRWSPALRKVGMLEIHRLGVKLTPKDVSPVDAQQTGKFCQPV